MSFNLQDNWTDASEFLTPGITWHRVKNNENNYLYTSETKGKILNIRLNDFPDEPMFSLIVDEREVIHFNEWPLEWGPRPKIS